MPSNYIKDSSHVRSRQDRLLHHPGTAEKWPDHRYRPRVPCGAFQNALPGAHAPAGGAGLHYRLQCAGESVQAGPVPRGVCPGNPQRHVQQGTGGVQRSGQANLCRGAVPHDGGKLRLSSEGTNQEHGGVQAGTGRTDFQPAPCSANQHLCGDGERQGSGALSPCMGAFTEITQNRDAQRNHCT